MTTTPGQRLALAPPEAQAELIKMLGHYTHEGRRRVTEAIALAARAHAGQTRADGAPYITHPLAVAKILAEWGADADTVIAGVLHDALEDTPVTLPEVGEALGETVASLVEGVTKFTQADLGNTATLERKIETLRKLFDVSRRDIRVAIIKLADRLHNVRTIERLPPERRRRFAQETLDIYAKIALHLGMHDLRRELSDRCFPEVQPELAAELTAFRDASARTGTALIRNMERAVRGQDAHGALAALTLHRRSLVSLAKEHAEHGSVRQGFALFAIAKDADACYDLLKIFHALYRPLGGEFHDSIAAPTENGEQSLRTTVLGPGNTILPLRIRTAAMEHEERLGILRTCFGPDRDRATVVSWLARSEQLDHATRESSAAFWEALQSDILEETVPVIVDGMALGLPRGATVLDALYAHHGIAAHRTVGVRVSSVPVSFATPLTADMVISTERGPAPRVGFDWLASATTTFARSLIVDMLKERSTSERIALGQSLLQKELDRYRRVLVGELSKSQRTSLAEHFRRETFDDVLALIGGGAILARDVVFHLYPEHRRRSLGRTTIPAYDFRLYIAGTAERQSAVLPKLHALSRLSDTEITRTNLRFAPGTKTFDLTIRGRSPDRLHFADFLAMLDRQDWTSRVETLLSNRQKIFLCASFAVAFAVILLDLLLLPQYPALLRELSFLPAMVLQTLPLLPIIAVNSYLLSLLRHHIVRMRTDRWFLGVAGLLNVAGLLLIILRSAFSGSIQQSLLPLLAIFVFSMLYFSYRFFQTEALLTGLTQRSPRSLSNREWTQLRRRKAIGYGIRLCAVMIWGLEPIYIRYTAANDVSPFLRTALLSIGVLLPCTVLLMGKPLLRARRLPRLSLPHDMFFLFLIIGQTGLMYFKNASLLYTSGTNMLLFSNFAPVIGLVVAAMFWRRDIAYLRQPRHMLWVFLLAVMSGVGSSLLLMNSLVGSSQTILGDLLAMIAVFFDVLLTVGQIEYLRKFPRTDGALLNLHIFSALLLFTAPLVLGLHLAGVPILSGLTWKSVLLSLGIGLFVGFGQMLNYAAFKRIDGYLAFMMFNLSVLITFTLEVFLIHAVRPTPLLLLSGGLIIGASVLAEYVNSRCERHGA